MMPHQLTYKEYFFYSIIGIFFSSMLLSAMHELGHGIYILIFGGDIIEINVFPINLFVDEVFDGGIIYYQGDFTELELFIIHAGGSMTTLIFGLILLCIVVKFNLRPVFELWALIYAAILILDFIQYSLFDLITIQFNIVTDSVGDFQKIFQAWSFSKYIFGFLSIFIFSAMLYTIFNKKSSKYLGF